jgi:histidinol-phosphatase (PHP family)
VLYYDQLIANKKQNCVFHVHTYRCTHADDIADEEYVRKAIEIGSRAIYFSDHAPFPGDPFFQRMKYRELDEYIAALSELREKYQNKIDIQIGLEAEYLSSYDLYYQELKEKLDFLLLGQHIYEVSPGVYHFNCAVTPKQKAVGILENIEAGLSKGFFDYLAHPDRFCDAYDQWNEEYQEHFDNIKRICREKHIPIEYNLSSAENSECSRQFWREIGNNEVIIGCDAHCLWDIEYFERFIKL